MEDNKVTKPRNKKLSRSALVIVIACAIILIPIVVFLGIIASSAIGNDKPVLGKRFNNDLEPAIKSSSESDIAKAIEKLSDVESVEIIMPTAQFRVNVDVKDSASKETIEEIGKKVYEIVNDELPINTYFSQSSDGKKMYDLEITVYNYIPDSTDDDNWISYAVTKNSKMSSETYQFISEPKSPELAASLNGENNADSTQTTESSTAQ